MIISVDPGAPLYMAALSNDGTALYQVTAEHDVAVPSGKTSWDNQPAMVVSLIRHWTQTNPALIVCESVSARAHEGTVSSAKYIGSYWMLRGIAAAMGIPFEEVSPAKWKRDLSLNHEKHKSLQMAMNLWPNKTDFFKRVKDHNRAEAALIGYWYANHRRATIQAAGLK